MAPVQLLEARGVNLHIDEDMTLCSAASNQSIKVTAHLLDEGAKANAQYRDALSNATSKGAMVMAQLLKNAKLLPYSL